jgi:integrase
VISYLANLDFNAFMIQKLAGHSAVDMTAHYTHIYIGKLQEATKALNMAYTDTKTDTAPISGKIDK